MWNMAGHDYILIDTNYDWATPVIMLNASQTRYSYSRNKTIHVDKYWMRVKNNLYTHIIR